MAVTTGHSAETLRIGLSLGLTGTYKRPAAMHERAYKLWEAEINEKGGLLGRPVEIIIEDDESDPERAREIYRVLISEDRVDLVFGPYSSAITLAVAPLVDEAEYPMLTPGASADKIWQQGYNNLFGVYSPASGYTLGMLALALIHDLTTIAIVYADDDFSVSVAEGVKRWAPKFDLQIVSSTMFQKGLQDLVPLAEQVRPADPSLLMVAGHYNESVQMRKALKDIKWYPTGYFATIGPVLLDYERDLGPADNLTLASSTWEPEGLNYPGSKEFAEAFRQRNDGMEPSYHAATAYAAGQILEAAIQSANSFDRDKIRQALYDLQTYSVVGRYAVDRTGVQVKHVPMIIQWQGRKKEIVWPEEIQSAKPHFFR
jgi:branched-chain amino acid transport system substrate-binding protein